MGFNHRSVICYRELCNIVNDNYGMRIPHRNTGNPEFFIRYPQGIINDTA